MLNHKTGPARLFNPQQSKEDRRKLRELRVLQMINLRLRGRAHTEIAEEFRLSEIHVKREINWAKRENLFETARETALALASKALKVYDKSLEMALESGDVEAARDIVYGLGILKKDGGNPAKPEEVVGGEIVTLEQWRAAKRLEMEAAAKAAHPQSGPPQLAEPITIDVTPQAEGAVHDYIEAETFTHAEPTGSDTRALDLDPLSGGVPTEPAVPISSRYTEGG